MSVRRCGSCKKEGHDKRNCAKFSTPAERSGPPERSGPAERSGPPAAAAAAGGGGGERSGPPAPVVAEPPVVEATGRKCGLCKTPGHQATKCPRKDELEAKKEARRDKRQATIQALWDSVPERDPTLPLVTDWKDPIFGKISWVVNTDPVKDGNMFDETDGNLEIVPLSPEIANRPFPNDWSSTWRFTCSSYFAPIPANKCSIMGLLMAIYIGNKYMMRRIGSGDHVFFEGFYGPGMVAIGS